MLHSCAHPLPRLACRVVAPGSRPRAPRPATVTQAPDHSMSLHARRTEGDARGSAWDPWGTGPDGKLQRARTGRGRTMGFEENGRGPDAGRTQAWPFLPNGLCHVSEEFVRSARAPWWVGRMGGPAPPPTAAQPQRPWARALYGL
eukprot:gene11750-biopygen356